MPPIPSLTWNNLLAAAASAHSKDMATNNFFVHESSTGKTTADRLNLVGYKSVAFTENIASGQIDEQAVMDACLASEGHCKNIMNVNVKKNWCCQRRQILDSSFWCQIVFILTELF